MASAEQIQRDFVDLAEQAERLCATAVLFADKIDNEVWKAGLLEEVDKTRDSIKAAPIRRAWDGELHEADLEVNSFFAPNQGVGENAKGARIRFKPLDITRESYSKGSQLANRDVAMKSLREAVAKHYAENETA